MTGAMYLTVSIDENAQRADDRMNAFLEGYYGVPATATRKRQASYAGPEAGLAAWLDSYARAGASHLMIRFAGGDHPAQLAAISRVRNKLNW
jgi:hypothetical protein